MIRAKDFAIGCLATLIIILCVALIPIFFFLFKLSLLIAIPLALIISLIFGIAILGKSLRFILTKKK